MSEICCCCCFHGDAPKPFNMVGEVGGGGEVEPLELAVLDKELQLADKLCEQLIESVSEVDRA